jgi:hypothetical protein
MFRSLGNASHLASVEPLESRQILSIAAVSIRAAAASTAEGVAASKAAAIVIERSGGDLASPLAVSFTLGGTADADDYASLPTDVVIPARARLLRIPVVAVDDAAAENPEQVVITLATSDAYAVVSNRRVATITINDNEPVISIQRSKDASEGKSTPTAGAFTIKRSGKDLSQPFTVDVVLQANSTAGEASDFVALPRSVTIPAGKSSVTLPVQPVQDTRDEGKETVSIALAPAARYRVDAKAAAATVTIADTLRVAVQQAMGVETESVRSYRYRAEGAVDGMRATDAGTATFTATREASRGVLSIRLVSDGDPSEPFTLDSLAIEQRIDGAYLSLRGVDLEGTGSGDWNLDPFRLSAATLAAGSSSKTSFSLASAEGSVGGTVSINAGIASARRIVTPAGTFNARSFTIGLKAKGSGLIASGGASQPFTFDLSFGASFFFTDDAGVVRATQSLEATIRGGGETHKAKATVVFDLAAVG